MSGSKSKQVKGARPNMKSILATSIYIVTVMMILAYLYQSIQS